MMNDGFLSWPAIPVKFMAPFSQVSSATFIEIILLSFYVFTTKRTIMLQKANKTEKVMRSPAYPFCLQNRQMWFLLTGRNRNNFLEEVQASLMIRGLC